MIKLNGILDLHGVRHMEIDDLVTNFILMNQDYFPVTIICGNSVTMIKLVNNVVEKLKCNSYNISYGKIIINGFK